MMITMHKFSTQYPFKIIKSHNFRFSDFAHLTGSLRIWYHCPVTKVLVAGLLICHLPVSVSDRSDADDQSANRRENSAVAVR